MYMYGGITSDVVWEKDNADAKVIIFIVTVQSICEVSSDCNHCSSLVCGTTLGNASISMHLIFYS